MKTFHVHKILEKDKELHLTELPYKRGQRVEIIVFAESLEKAQTSPTARQLLNFGLIGLWKNRQDIKDSSGYDRELREEAQRRN